MIYVYNNIKATVANIFIMLYGGIILIILNFIAVIVFRFESTSYTFFEDAGIQRDAINVIKQQGHVSEQNLVLLVDHTPFSATFGMIKHKSNCNYILPNKQ